MTFINNSPLLQQALDSVADYFLNDSDDGEVPEGVRSMHAHICDVIDKTITGSAMERDTLAAAAVLITSPYLPAPEDGYARAYGQKVALMIERFNQPRGDLSLPMIFTLLTAFCEDALETIERNAGVPGIDYAEERKLLEQTRKNSNALLSQLKEPLLKERYKKSQKALASAIQKIDAAPKPSRFPLPPGSFKL